MPIVAGAEGVVGRLQIGTIFVVGGTEGVVGALIVVVVGLGSWLGGPGGSPRSDANQKKFRVNFSNRFFERRDLAYNFIKN